MHREVFLAEVLCIHTDVHVCSIYDGNSIELGRFYCRILLKGGGGGANV